MNQIVWIGLFLVSLNSSAQTKKITYADIPIDIPAGYKADSETSISGDNFTMQWTGISEIMYEKNVHKQMIRQTEMQMHGKFISGVVFFSHGSKMSGRLYQVKSDTPIKYKILAYGIVNKKPVILNMGFAKQPIQNSDLDDFMRMFIDFEK